MLKRKNFAVVRWCKFLIIYFFNWLKIIDLKFGEGKNIGLSNLWASRVSRVMGSGQGTDSIY